MWKKASESSIRTSRTPTSLVWYADVVALDFSNRSLYCFTTRVAVVFFFLNLFFFRIFLPLFALKNLFAFVPFEWILNADSFTKRVHNESGVDIVRCKQVNRKLRSQAILTRRDSLSATHTHTRTSYNVHQCRPITKNATNESEANVLCEKQNRATTQRRTILAKWNVMLVFGFASAQMSVCEYQKNDISYRCSSSSSISQDSVALNCIYSLVWTKHNRHGMHSMCKSQTKLIDTDEIPIKYVNESENCTNLDFNYFNPVRRWVVANFNSTHTSRGREIHRLWIG